MKKKGKLGEEELDAATYVSICLWLDRRTRTVLSDWRPLQQSIDQARMGPGSQEEIDEAILLELVVCQIMTMDLGIIHPSDPTSVGRTFSGSVI